MPSSPGIGVDTRAERGLVSGVSDEAVENPKKVPFWLWPNVLGFDAPLVAVAWQFFFADLN